jgi:SAM-dependent methyltransferase
VRPDVLPLLCDPVDHSELTLEIDVHDDRGGVREGRLVSRGGRIYPIRRGIPRFVEQAVMTDTVHSFGDEWNYFNFDEFKLNWLNHTVANTFGGLEAFRGKVVVDCGGGSGVQSLWMSQAGAKQVICLELSHSVDDVMQRNLRGVDNVDVIQCSIDAPPLKARSIDGIVICHNVIQHTPSVEGTARALYETVAPGGELVFNCYPKHTPDLVRHLRYEYYQALRRLLSGQSFNVRLWYSRLMAIARFVPGLGTALEKSYMVFRGDVPAGPDWVRRAYRQAFLDTFDWYGAHAYQHHKTEDEIRALVSELQPDASKVQNLDRYFASPPPPGCALRVFR